MQKTNRLVQGLIAIGVIAAVILGWRVLRPFDSAELADVEIVTAQEPPSTKEPAADSEERKPDEEVPTAGITDEPYPPPVTPWYEHLLTPMPTLTMPPVPTRRPTPVVTKVPLANPPFIEGLPDEEVRPYRLLFPDESRTSIRVVDVDASSVIEQPPIALPVNILPKATEVDAASDNASDGSDATGKQTYLPAVAAPDSVNAAALSSLNNETSLYIVNDKYYTSWGATSPTDNQAVLVLRNYPEERTPYNAEQVEPYSEDKPFQYSLHLLDLSTNQMEHLVDGGVDPVWSPDGTRIAYRNYSGRGLWLLDVKSKETNKLVGFEENTEHTADGFVWSPDGQQIAYVKTYSNFAASGGLWVYDLRAQQATELVEQEFILAGLRWAPENQEVLFVTSRGEKSIDENFTNLWKIDVLTGQLVQLTHNMNVFGHAWSPDGRWIAYTAINMLEDAAQQRDLWLMNGNGDNLKRLTDNVQSETGQLIWEPNQALLTYAVKRDSWQIDLKNGRSQEFISEKRGGLRVAD